MNHLPILKSLLFAFITLCTATSFARPETVAPLFATAKAEKSANPDEGIQVTLRCPIVSWQTAKKEARPHKAAIWTEVQTEIGERALTLKFLESPRSQIPGSQVTTLDGTPVTIGQMLAKLKKETPVLVSLTGKPVDPYYRPFLNPKTLVFILARDEGMGDASLLPQKKAP